MARLVLEVIPVGRMGVRLDYRVEGCVSHHLRLKKDMTAYLVYRRALAVKGEKISKVSVR